MTTRVVEGIEVDADGVPIRPITRPEFCRLEGVSKDTAFEAIKTGRLTAYQITGKRRSQWRISPDAVRAYRKGDRP